MKAMVITPRSETEFKFINDLLKKLGITTSTMTAEEVLTNPAQGVMATSPATAPDTAPRVVACPAFNFSINSQPNSAEAAATWVFTSA